MLLFVCSLLTVVCQWLRMCFVDAVVVCCRWLASLSLVCVCCRCGCGLVRLVVYGVLWLYVACCLLAVGVCCLLVLVDVAAAVRC